MKKLKKVDKLYKVLINQNFHIKFIVNLKLLNKKNIN